MKLKIGILASILLLVLGACSTKDSTLSDKAWSAEEVNQVFDLSELGEIETLSDGTVLVGGKVLDNEHITFQVHGKDYNLLGLSDEVLNALPIDARDALEFASADEIKDTLAAYGLSMADIAELRAGNQMIGLQEFESLALKAASNTDLSTQSSDWLLTSVLEALELDQNQGSDQ